jgi:hypothetical protein
VLGSLADTDELRTGRSESYPIPGHWPLSIELGRMDGPVVATNSIRPGAHEDRQLLDQGWLVRIAGSSSSIHRSRGP